MIERSHPTLSIGTQCRLLSISRSEVLPRNWTLTEAMI